jgi:hypothetical protein
MNNGLKLEFCDDERPQQQRFVADASDVNSLT